MNPYLSGSRPQFLGSSSHGRRQIQTPQKLVLPAIQNNANSKTSISSKNSPAFNVGSPKSTAHNDYASSPNPFHQQNKAISETFLRSESIPDSKKYPDSALYQSQKARIGLLYSNQSPLLSPHFNSRNSIDINETLNLTDKRGTRTEESPILRKKDHPDFSDKNKYVSLGDSLEALLSHDKDTCSSARLGSTSARSPQDEIIIRPAEKKTTAKRKSKRVVTLDGKVRVEKSFHSVEPSPKLGLNISAMSLKATFAKEKQPQEHLNASEAEKDKFTGRSINRSLTEQIALKQREKALLQELGVASPRFKRNSPGKSLLERVNPPVDAAAEFPVAFMPIRIKKETPEVSVLPKILEKSHSQSQNQNQNQNPEKGLTLAEYFSQEEEKRKQQRVVHETVADKVIEEESESNVSIMQDEKQEAEKETFQSVWPQRGASFKRKAKHLF